MIGIMQPYFFPYIGYFQLIHAVDTYVNLDHVAFMKRSYMTRNVLKNNTKINIPVWGGSQNKTCREVLVNFSNEYTTKFVETLRHLYRKETNYQTVIDNIVLPEFYERTISISDFNFGIIKRICEYLNITTKLINTSSVFDLKMLRKEAALKSIVHSLNESHYVNAIGGMSLYDKDDFKKDNIELSFIKMNHIEVDNQYASILDLLFRYSKEHVQEQLTKYTLL